MNCLLPLKISQLHFNIEQRQLLNAIDLQLVNNGICLIMGHNGAGKSLLLRCMHGLLKPGSGTVMWNNAAAGLLATRQKQAMVFQKPLMLNRSVAANIHYVLKQRGQPLTLCEHYLKSANLETKGKQAARSLSGGEQQRLAIARAIATEPAVLFLDEPTANLDPQATRQIESQILDAMHQSIKVIMVSHDIAQAKRLADEIVFMQAGSVTEHTDARQFFTQPRSEAARDYLSAYLN